MTGLVAERALAPASAGAGAARLVVVPRDRRARRRGWRPLAPDDVVAALESAGGSALVLARAPAADPGAAALPGLARVMGREVVRLPDDAAAAAWAVAVAVAWPPDAGLARRLQVLVGAAGGGTALPRRRVGESLSVPAVRPPVLARWAGCVWRPCARCGGGGLPGASCGRCGAGLVGAGA
jgi:hypothetical protein